MKRHPLGEPEMGLYEELDRRLISYCSNCDYRVACHKEACDFNNGFNHCKEIVKKLIGGIPFGY